LLVAIAMSSVIAGSASGASRKHAESATARDGPFGIAMGEPLAEIGPVQEMEPGRYLVLRPPKPDGRFTNVFVIAHASTGVCQIFAASDANEDDPAAQTARANVDDVADSLTQKYGPATKKDDDCDDSDGECASGLAQKLAEGTAHYQYGWNFDKAPRPDHIGIIGVGITAYGPTRTATNLIYMSDRVAGCGNANAAAGASAL
jgi:hypothetical protein